MSDLQEMLNFSQKFNTKLKKFSGILKRYFDIENFWYAKTTQDSRHGSLEFNCSYQEYYFESRAFATNPLIKDHLTVQPGYICYAFMEDYFFQDSLQACEKRFKIRPAVGFSRRSQGDLIRIGFSVSAEDYAKKVNYIISNIHLLEEFETYFVREAEPMIRELDDHLFDFRNDIKPQPIKELASTGSANIRLRFLEELHGLKKDALYSLTPREMDCMKYLHQGLTSRQMSQQMHISPRTVEHHIENIKLKLDCDSKNDLVPYASLMAKCLLF